LPCGVFCIGRHHTGNGGTPIQWDFRPCPDTCRRRC
jgi:hypothetical protein